jgi:hypothetical protein
LDTLKTNKLDDSVVHKLSSEKTTNETSNSGGSGGAVKTKIVDVQETTDFILMNPVLSVFALGELKYREEFLFEKMLKLNGFVFLLRIIAYQIVISGINKMGQFAAVTLLLVEIGFMTNNIKNYIKFKHFRKRIMIVGKIVQGLCLLVFMIICVILAGKNINSIEPVPRTPQVIARFCIVTVIFLQMVFTIVMIVLGIIDKILNKKKGKKPDPLKKGTIKYMLADLSKASGDLEIYDGDLDVSQRKKSYVSSNKKLSLPLRKSQNLEPCLEPGNSQDK